MDKDVEAVCPEHCMFRSLILHFCNVLSAKCLLISLCHSLLVKLSEINANCEGEEVS